MIKNIGKELKILKEWGSRSISSSRKIYTPLHNGLCCIEQLG